MTTKGRKRLTLSQTTHFRLHQTKDFADDSFKFNENGGKFYSLYRWKTIWEKEKLLVKSNLSFSHSVFKRFVL